MPTIDNQRVMLGRANEILSGSIQLLAGVISIGLGTVLAVFNVPEDVETPAALFVPALIMTIGLLVPILLQLRSNLTSVMRVENLLCIGLIYWLLLDPLQSAYGFYLVTTSTVEWSFIAIGGFALAIVLGASGQGWDLPKVVQKTASKQLSTRTIFHAIWVAFFLGMAKFAVACNFDPVLMIQGVGMERWAAPWGRGDFGGYDAFFDHMQYFGYILPSLCVMIAVRVGWMNSRVIIGLILSAIVLAFLVQGGGRRIIGVVVGAAIFTWVASKPKLRFGVVLGSGLVVVALLAFMQEMLRYRNVGFQGWNTGAEPQINVSHLHVDDNFLRLAQLMEFYPSKVDYVFHEPMFHALCLPIPRVFWPGKPIGPGFDLPGLLGLKGVSLTSSIIGELYVSFGIVTVLLGGWVLGRLAGMWNKIIFLPGGPSRPLLFGLGLMAMFAGLRSVQALVQMSYIVLAWIAVAAMLPTDRRGAGLPAGQL